ncbi:MAG: Na/Pi symporter [Patescibacteria group bacterium]
MDTSTIITTVFSLIIVFLFAVQKFSHQIQRVAGDRLKNFLNNWTSTPIKGVLSGTLLTTILQSSTATTVILVGLVNASIITSRNALGVVIGANIGPSISAQLVALNMTYIAPIIVIVGFIISHTKTRFKRYGKAIFYFGVVFLSLFIIANIISPLKDNVDFQNILVAMSNPYKAIIAGAIITAILQSSSVFTGIVIILGSQGLITLPAAIGFMLGSNIGSPLTAIVASTSASFEAKKVAIAQILFNILGVLIFIPLIYPFMSLLEIISQNETQQIVNAHFLFNIICAILCLTFFDKFEKLVKQTTKIVYKN